MLADIKSYVFLKKEELKKEVLKLEVKPHLLIIQVNDDVASNSYIKGKIKDCSEIGVICDLLKLDINVSQSELLSIIDKYNKDNKIHGILVQMPLPKQINEDVIKQSIDPKKDVDGFNKLSKFKPCTPYGIIKYLEFINYEFKSKKAVIINRSNIVGKPLINLLLEKDCNVTVLHSKTTLEDMKYYLQHADLIVSAIGKPHILKGYNFKKDAVLIDVGISRIDGKLCGDFETNNDVKLQTPVPGGIGLITRLTLLENLLEAYRNEL